MAGVQPSEVHIRINSKRHSRRMIHPVEIDPPPPPLPPSSASATASPVVYQEVKHFKKWVPWMIPAFVIANTIMFFITMYVNNCPKNSVSCIATFLGRLSFQPFKENPLLGPSSSTLEKMGALDVNKVVHGHQGWRLITCNWLHAGLFHILANMLSLLVIGIRLEREFGFVRIGLLYAISGLGGSVLSALFIQTNISVGASGAVFGLLGGMLSELITNWTLYANKFAALLTLVIIVVVNLAVGILPHVDNFAHIGGFFLVFFLGLLLAWFCSSGELMQMIIVLGVIICLVSPLQNGAATRSLYLARQPRQATSTASLAQPMVNPVHIYCQTQPILKSKGYAFSFAVDLKLARAPRCINFLLQAF
ncbi:rhomboid-like protein 1 [Quercus suber]|uniref:RHOMBOID-like protein n=1 Tax=Quercus suber TaxID=58331 RepID=A0AAW0L5J5_QUESU